MLIYICPVPGRAPIDGDASSNPACWLSSVWWGPRTGALAPVGAEDWSQRQVHSDRYLFATAWVAPERGFQETRWGHSVELCQLPWGEANCSLCFPRVSFCVSKSTRDRWSWEGARAGRVACHCSLSHWIAWCWESPEVPFVAAPSQSPCGVLCTAQGRDTVTAEPGGAACPVQQGVSVGHSAPAQDFGPRPWPCALVMHAHVPTLSLPPALPNRMKTPGRQGVNNGGSERGEIGVMPACCALGWSCGGGRSALAELPVAGS